MREQLREQLGVWLKDRWRYERCLRSRSNRYLTLANRYEKVSPSADGSGFVCNWQHTSRLHAPGVQPSLGLRLLRRCLAAAPIERRARPDHSLPSVAPQISVLIGHRGLERLPLLLATLETIAAQREVRLECLVIEQDEQSLIRSVLPDWVRHIHAPLSSPDAPYNRSHTFNVGAREARGEVLLLHDNDMLLPSGYGRRLLDRVEQGYEVINPKRYIFYLNPMHSAAVLKDGVAFDAAPTEAIVQNLEAGGSMAIRRDTYHEIGGMDEGFVGWGGEDNEFWDRCLTRPTWIWGYEPIVHLWHRSQPLKEDRDNPNLTRAREVMAQPAQQRIANLRQAQTIQQGR
jgi:hypothetical protein